MRPGVRRFSLLLLTTIYAFGFIDRVVIALVAQNLKTDLRISDLQIGLLAGTAFSLVNVCASLPIARLAERRRRSWLVAGALLVGSLFTALCAGVSNFAQLVLLRLGMAVGTSGTEAPAHSMISDLFDRSRRASALSLFMLGVPIASVLGSYAGGSVAQHYGWRAAFLVLGGLGVLVALFALLTLPEPARHAAGEDTRASIGAVVARLWRHVDFRHAALGTALVTLGSFGVNTFLPAFLIRNFGLNPGTAGLTFGLITGSASALGSVIGGYGSERLARYNPGWLTRLPGVCLFAGAPLLVLGVTRAQLASAAPIILIGSICFYMAMAPAIALTHSLLDSRSRATGSALFLMFVHLIGQGLGPPLAGWVSDRVSIWQYGSGDFPAVCAGAAGNIPGSACALASAAGVRYAIAAFAIIYLWAGWHLVAASRTRGQSHAAVVT